MNLIKINLSRKAMSDMGQKADLTASKFDLPLADTTHWTRLRLSRIHIGICGQTGTDKINMTSQCI